MSDGWGNIEKPSLYDVEGPTPEELHAVGKFLDDWGVIVAEALARVPLDETFTAERRDEQVTELLLNPYADKLHAWAEMLERGQARWETDGST